MTIRQRTITYAVCPTCGQDAGVVDHLLGSHTHTTWYCDACGRAYSLQFHPDGQVGITAMRDAKIETTDVLVLPPQAQPVYFVVRGMRFSHNPDPDGAKQFFYEEHSCPTNWLHPEMVYCDGDADPHGLLKFVSSTDSSMLPPDESCGPNAHDDALVALIVAAQRKTGER
jgi:hypothetical protein